jgi:hypothetical protein
MEMENGNGERRKVLEKLSFYILLQQLLLNYFTTSCHTTEEETIAEAAAAEVTEGEWGVEKWGYLGFHLKLGSVSNSSWLPEWSWPCRCPVA